MSPATHSIQSKDGILTPLVTIQHHWVLEKEKEKAKWDRVMGRVTQENRGRHEHTDTKHTNVWICTRLTGYGGPFHGQTCNIHLQQYTLREHACIHTTHKGGLFTHSKPHTHEYMCAYVIIKAGISTALIMCLVYIYIHLLNSHNNLMRKVLLQLSRLRRREVK